MRASANVLLPLVILGWAIGADAATPETGNKPAIHIEDVARFYRVYDAASGHPSAEMLQQYIDQGSEGLRYFARSHNTTGARIADEISKHPELYVNARRCMHTLPRVRSRVAIVLRKLKELYPEANLQPVTVVVGRGRPVAIADEEHGVQLALEGMCDVAPSIKVAPSIVPSLEDRFVHIIAHEYGHVQQFIAFDNDPHPTVLGGALMEGAAEFNAEMNSGGVSNYEQAAFAKGHEQEIERAFVKDEDSQDLSKWLYNRTDRKLGVSAESSERHPWPPDMGYWVGYRICKAYYQHAKDKRQAFRDILQISDPKLFLAKSGWYPGIVLQ
jgi:Predicted Zn-dependent protease (DUF2268)